MLQSIKELEKWHKGLDPWDYENNPEDKKRKNILLSEIPEKKYKNVLDIGCGQGFITRDLPGENILGIDISYEAIKKAKHYETDKIKFRHASLFDLEKIGIGGVDLVIITGVLYPQYIGHSLNLIYSIIDGILNERGTLISVHINEWYRARFPYLLLREYFYNYREYTHRLEVYVK